MHTTAAPHITHQPEARWYGDGLFEFLVPADATDGQLSVLRATMPAGFSPPKHIHTREDEVFVVLDGDVCFDVDGEVRLAGPGTTVYMPRGIPHTFRVESPTARVLVFCAPARFDGFVQAVSDPAPADELPPRGRPFDPEQFAATAAEFGIELLGPPGTLPQD